MMIHFPKITANLKLNQNSTEKLHRYFKLCLSYVEFESPEDLNRETGRIIQLLTQHPDGLSREHLLNQFYENYDKASFNRQISLKACLEKIIQRSRSQFKKYNMTIAYCRTNKIYKLELI